MGDKYRLITRSDFDGLVCAVLLQELDIIDDILFVHPRDMQTGKITVSNRDITTNVPYVEGVYLAFDHHHSETLRNTPSDNHVIFGEAKSAARVVYNYYGGTERFPARWNDMMDAVDKADAAEFSIEEVLYPEKWALLNFVMDPRTGLGRFRDFTISNYQLMMSLIEHCKEKTIEQILMIPDVKERVDLYFEHEEKFKMQLFNCVKTYDNLIFLDLRKQPTIFAGNRFMIYALFPDCNISIHAMWGKDKSSTVFAVGKSIFKRDSQTNIGELMLKYGGGGHKNAGTCQIPNEQSEDIKNQLIQTINQDG